MTDLRGSRFLSASAPEVPGAPPLAYRDVDLLGRPERPDRRFSLTVEPEAVVAVIGDERSGIEALGQLALGLRAPTAGSVNIALGPTGRLTPFQKRNTTRSPPREIQASRSRHQP